MVTKGPLDRFQNKVDGRWFVGKWDYELPAASIILADCPDEETAIFFQAAPDMYEALEYARRFLKPGVHDTEWIDGILKKVRGGA